MELTSGAPPKEAKALFDNTVMLLDNQMEGSEHGGLESIFEHYLNME